MKKQAKVKVYATREKNTKYITFFKKDRVPTPREQNIKYCEFIKEIELTSLENEIQSTTGFVNKNTMTDLLQKRKME